MHRPTSWPTRLLRLGRLGMHLLRGLLVIATRYPRLSQPARAVITQRWSRHLLHILAIKVRVHGTPPAVYPPNTLVVANHVSWLDIFALNSVTVSRFVAKKELRDWPLAGFLIKNAGTLFIDRNNRRDASRVNEQLAKALQDGGCMAVFPEATTSDGRSLLPFKASLFEASRLAHATVQPVAIRYLTPGGHYCAAAAYAGDTSFWQSLCLILASRAMVVELSYTAAIPPYDTALASRFQLSETARDAIRDALQLPAEPVAAE
ncbi:lysophospholipid acyltransferase family protein [Vogesella indigofera]|uniref:lysophospholipid acyltransferase family protein n=1 Tax=Vogesella indigofera TaxID=45465 RepID=UPI00234EA830|nr:lysophospholipid acyltransferase family protein [Vogesella indigofera]MDC7700894.1 lysophospholipid acyltransferase family protein [Vogesella indigofera]